EGQFATKTDNAEKPASNLPDWVKQRRVREGDTEWLVVSSSQHADFEAAAAEAQARATQAMTAEFQRVHPECFRWIAPVQLTDSAFRKSHVEELKHDFGRFSGTMYRVYWQVELSPALYSQMYTEWSHQMRLERLWAMCGVVGVVTLLLALSAGYFSLFGSSPRLRLSTHSA
ncbi:MAG TPA: hypothetical protein VHB77_16095, partial [Planctomycetaceae bacterium]|nr:hypothetical protein [Planctomycetaceae bacterium]